MGEGLKLELECEYTDWGAKVIYPNITVDDRNYDEFVSATARYNNTLNVRRLLVDARELNRHVSVGKLHEVVTKYGPLGAIGKRVAIISSAMTDVDGSTFLTDICANRGLRLQFFFAEQEALIWLLDGLRDVRSDH